MFLIDNYEQLRIRFESTKLLVENDAGDGYLESS